MAWLPAMPGVSLFSDADTHGKDSFAKFTLPVEDPGAPSGYRRTEVASLHDIRRLERESEARNRNGEGQVLRWRDYSQDRSNWDVHTIAPDPSLRPGRLSNGQRVSVRRGAAVAEDHGSVEDAPTSGPCTLAPLEA